MAKRKFRIVKRENNIPVLGVCEFCNAGFMADPATIGRPKDAHAFIQKQFIAHRCKRLIAPACDKGGWGASRNLGIALLAPWVTVFPFPLPRGQEDRTNVHRLYR
jgi:hypothetical protein